MMKRCGHLAGGQAEHLRLYAERGIKVCAEWQEDKATFFRWAMSHGYAHGLLIDREDNDGDYEPGNCRFVTPAVSVRNRRCMALDAKAVGEIRRLLATGVSQTEIASRFRVRQTAISNIKCGKTWIGVSV